MVTGHFSLASIFILAALLSSVHGVYNPLLAYRTFQYKGEVLYGVYLYCPSFDQLRWKLLKAWDILVWRGPFALVLNPPLIWSWRECAYECESSETNCKNQLCAGGYYGNSGPLIAPREMMWCRHLPSLEMQYLTEKSPSIIPIPIRVSGTEMARWGEEQ